MKNRKNQKCPMISSISLLAFLLLSGCGDPPPSKTTEPDPGWETGSESDTADKDPGQDPDSISDPVSSESGSDTGLDSDTESDTEDTDTECNSGPCCDSNGFFKGPLDGVCGRVIEHRCAKGVCEAIPEFRTVLIFCSGSSAECNGDTSDPTWAPLSKCNHNEVCEIDGDGFPQCIPCGEPKICQFGRCFGESKLLPVDGNIADTFGASVSVSGDFAVIGAPRDGENGFHSGSAYIFKRDVSGDWVETAKLLPTDGAQGQSFGRSVSVSGNVVIIGANSDGTLNYDYGAAYVFERNEAGFWPQKSKLLASDGSYEHYFGNSVSISENVAIIGAPGISHYRPLTGSAYIFERSDSGEWIEKSKLVASDAASQDRFGWSVSISGKTAIIGATYNDGLESDSGSAYIFEQDASGNWTEKQKLVASDGAAFDLFGYSVSISENVAIIGARQDNDNGDESGSAYIFERDESGHWTQKSKLLPDDGRKYDHFGTSVSISGDLALIGATGDDDNGDNSGSAYIFERDEEGHWKQKSHLVLSEGRAGDVFGISVSISGNMTIIGSSGDQENGSNAGAAYIF